MGVVMFYQLSRSGAEQTVRTLLDRAMGQGWRIMIRSTDAAALNRLDERLWLHPEDGFLPHGREGGSADADQPVLLGMGPITNRAKGLMLLDQAEASETEARDLERVWVIFDGAHEDQLISARRYWKHITDLGLPAQYWSEDSGRWEKRAEKN